MRIILNGSELAGAFAGTGTVSVAETAEGLETGGVFDATVIFVSENKANIRLESGAVIRASLEGGVRLAEGEKVRFLVGGRDGNRIVLIPEASAADADIQPESLSDGLFPSGAGEGEIAGAAKACGYPPDASLQERAAAILAAYPRTGAAAAVFIAANRIPATPENLRTAEALSRSDFELGRLIEDFFVRYFGRGSADDVPVAAPEGAGKGVRDSAPEGAGQNAGDTAPGGAGQNVRDAAQEGDILDTAPEGTARRLPPESGIERSAADLTAGRPDAAPAEGPGRTDGNGGGVDTAAYRVGWRGGMPDAAGAAEEEIGRSGAARAERSPAEEAGEDRREPLRTGGNPEEPPPVPAGGVYGRVKKPVLPPDYALPDGRRRFDTGEKQALVDAFFTEIDDNCTGESLKRAAAALPSGLERLGGCVPDAGGGEARREADRLTGAVRLFAGISPFAYVQVPVRADGRRSTLQLYVRRRIRGAEEPHGGLGVILVFDTVHMGRIEAFLRTGGGGLSVRFTAGSGEISDYVRGHAAKLYGMLAEAGYRVSGIRFGTAAEKTNPVVCPAFLRQDDPVGEHRINIRI